MVSPESKLLSENVSLRGMKESLDILTVKVAELQEAFPDGVTSHRDYHAKLIKAAIADESFMRDLKLDAAKKGLWVLVLTLTGIFVIGLQAKLRSFIGVL